MGGSKRAAHGFCVFRGYGGIKRHGLFYLRGGIYDYCDEKTGNRKTDRRSNPLD
jgi:hypothetical protein